MSITLTATQVKASILALLDEVAAGEEVEITKHGAVVARLVPARGAHALRGGGRRDGEVRGTGRRAVRHG